MKAEHRKELQTNKLADVLGRTVRKVRSTSGIPWLKIGLVALVVGGIFLAWVLWNNKKKANSELWVDIDASTYTMRTQANPNGGGTLAKLEGDEYKETNQGKAARFQIAFDYLWNHGMKTVGINTFYAYQTISLGRKYYEELAKDCKGDPIWEPEALYSIAVATEALACFKDEKSGDLSAETLEEALKLYQELSKGDYAKSAYGQLAAKRAAQLSDPAQKARILTFYREFAARSKT